MLDQSAESPSNVPEWSVSELSQALRRTVEEAYGYVRVRGEISGFRGPHSSGHAYFALKDEGAKIEAVIWKGTYARLKTKPTEGLEVIVHGKLTTFPGKSSYQIVIDRLEPAGPRRHHGPPGGAPPAPRRGGPVRRGEKTSHPIPSQVIGVVTSPTGAVIRDILHRLEDRFARHVIVWPVRVQGETSAAEVAAAIAGFDALPAGGPIPRPDVLIVARGGGSLEDLLSFSDEAVIRAAARCAIPIVSAVGHETDWTLLDQVADRRAPTPTGAAEMVVPVRSELVATLADRSSRLTGAVVRLGERRRSDLRNLARVLPSAEALLQAPRQRLDLASGRLTRSLILNVRRHQQVYEAACRRLAAQDPRARLGGSPGAAGRPRRRASAAPRTSRSRAAATPCPDWPRFSTPFPTRACWPAALPWCATSMTVRCVTRRRPARSRSSTCSSMTAASGCSVSGRPRGRAAKPKPGSDRRRAACSTA